MEEREKRRRAAEERLLSTEIIVNRPFPGTLVVDAQKKFTFRKSGELLKQKGLHAYVRHQFTNYLDLLQQLRAGDFSYELYRVLRQRVDFAVAQSLVEWAQSHLPGDKTALPPYGSEEH